MRLTLVQPPGGLYDRNDLAPPLGLLTLAACVEHLGVEVRVVDMNLRGICDHSWVRDDFYSKAVKAVADTNPDLVGLTSMALESHVCIELARRLKTDDPGIRIVVGGPHFSTIAQSVLKLYPWVDFVVTGEGETALSGIVRHLQRGPSVGNLANVAWRGPAGVECVRERKPLGSLNELPFPAYEKVDLSRYFNANPKRLLDYEHGRGCIFRCAFCYSPEHWGQGSQVKQAERVVREVARHHALGARHLFFVQDNFPNSKPQAYAVCKALAEARIGVTWNCYATLPHLVPEFLDHLAAAGCTSIFVGVDAVTSTSKKSFAKGFFKGWDKLSERLRHCLDRSIVPTCAFMIDPPGRDHKKTDSALLTALLTRVLGCGIRLNTLTIYNGTATERGLQGEPRYYSDAKPSLLLDTPPVVQSNPYARQHPELFPFHSTVMHPERYQRFVAGMHYAYTLFASFPRTLLHYSVRDGGSLWGLLDHYAQQLGDLRPAPAWMRRPMQRELFLREFPKRSLSRETLAAFDLELTEFHLSNEEPRGRVDLQVGEQKLTCPVGPFGVVDLPRPPGSYDSLVAHPGEETSQRPYLVSRQNNKFEYYDVSADVLQTLDRISRPRHTRLPLEVSPALFAELVNAGVVHQPVSEGY